MKAINNLQNAAAYATRPSTTTSSRIRRASKSKAKAAELQHKEQNCKHMTRKIRQESTHPSAAGESCPKHRPTARNRALEEPYNRAKRGERRNLEYIQPREARHAATLRRTRRRKPTSNRPKKKARNPVSHAQTKVISQSDTDRRDQLQDAPQLKNTRECRYWRGCTTQQ